MPHSEQVGAPSNIGRGSILEDGESSIEAVTIAGGNVGTAVTVAAGKADSPLCVK